MSLYPPDADRSGEAFKRAATPPDPLSHALRRMSGTNVAFREAIARQSAIPETDMLLPAGNLMPEGADHAAVVPVTVLFADIRGFTSLVEEYPPKQVVRQLNEYFAWMTRIIVEQDGILDKYMGDEIMAYFECRNPMEYPEAAYKAVTAGIEMIRTLSELNLLWAGRGWPTLNTGIGINTGPVLKGTIGCRIKLETTIIGDTVNVASRLQQLNKDYHSRLLMSGTTLTLIQGEFPVISRGNCAIRGRKKPLDVYELDFKILEDQIAAFLDAPLPEPWADAGSRPA